MYIKNNITEYLYTDELIFVWFYGFTMNHYVYELLCFTMNPVIRTILKGL